MEDLFEQLKAEPPINRNVKPPMDSPVKKNKYDKFNAKLKSPVSSPSRRESLPSPSSKISLKKTKKSRSVSPSYNAAAKRSLKVLIERRSPLPSLGEKKKAPKPKENEYHNISVLEKNKSYRKSEQKSVNQKSESFTKTMPTKAQQKLFDPIIMKKVQQLKKFKIKHCVVRLKRLNDKDIKRLTQSKSSKKNTPRKISSKKDTPKRNSSKKDSSKNYSLNIDAQKDFPNKNSSKTESPKTVSPKTESPKKDPPKKDIKTKKVSEEGIKRKSPSTQTEDSPPKRARSTHVGKESKQKKEFFIKLSSSPPKKLDIKKNPAKEKISSKTTIPVKTKYPKKTNASVSKSTTKPTKFTRTQLIKTFGQRFFCTRVKIERCTHPLMLTFESNARARKLQAKRNKSKNLTVSFNENVEVIGDSDLETISSDEDFSPVASTSQAIQNVMPARLKKVENGKVIDDIELDPSLFIDPKTADCSTPFLSPVRKKRKKCYVLLKGDGSPSPRKEQLKLANEKLPPSGLRRLNTDDVDEDEDDDCEYIVPIEIPQRRVSRGNSNSSNIATDSPTTVTDAGNKESYESAKDDQLDSSNTCASAREEPLAVPNDETNQIETLQNKDPKLSEIVNRSTIDEIKKTEEDTERLTLRAANTTTIPDDLPHMENSKKIGTESGAPCQSVYRLNNCKEDKEVYEKLPIVEVKEIDNMQLIGSIECKTLLGDLTIQNTVNSKEVEDKKINSKNEKINDATNEKTATRDLHINTLLIEDISKSIDNGLSPVSSVESMKDIVDQIYNSDVNQDKTDIEADKNIVDQSYEANEGKFSTTLDASLNLFVEADSNDTINLFLGEGKNSFVKSSNKLDNLSVDN